MSTLPRCLCPGYGHLVICTSSQCHIYNTTQLGPPHIFDLKVRWLLRGALAAISVDLTAEQHSSAQRSWARFTSLILNVRWGSSLGVHPVRPVSHSAVQHGTTWHSMACCLPLP